jgi:hypothetical protein
MTRMDAKFNQEKIIRANSCDSRADLFFSLIPKVERVVPRHAVGRRGERRRRNALAEKSTVSVAAAVSAAKIHFFDKPRCACCRARVRRRPAFVRLRRGKHACPYTDTRMRLRASADARGDHPPSPSYGVAGDHRSLEMFAPAKISTGEAAAWDDPSVLAEASQSV